MPVGHPRLAAGADAHALCPRLVVLTLGLVLAAHAFARRTAWGFAITRSASTRSGARRRCARGTLAVGERRRVGSASGLGARGWRSTSTSSRRDVEGRGFIALAASFGNWTPRGAALACRFRRRRSAADQDGRRAARSDPTQFLQCCRTRDARGARGAVGRPARRRRSASRSRPPRRPGAARPARLHLRPCTVPPPSFVIASGSQASSMHSRSRCAGRDDARARGPRRDDLGHTDFHGRRLGRRGRAPSVPGAARWRSPRYCARNGPRTAAHVPARGGDEMQGTLERTSLRPFGLAVLNASASMPPPWQPRVRLGIDTLRARQREMRYRSWPPRVREKVRQAPRVLRPYTIVERDGVRLGIIGFATPDNPRTMP